MWQTILLLILRYSLCEYEKPLEGYPKELTGILTVEYYDPAKNDDDFDWENMNDFLEIIEIGEHDLVSEIYQTNADYIDLTIEVLS